MTPQQVLFEIETLQADSFSVLTTLHRCDWSPEAVTIAKSLAAKIAERYGAAQAAYVIWKSAKAS